MEFRKNYTTRGWQLFFHRIRMAGQAFKWMTLISCLSIVLFAVIEFNKIPTSIWGDYLTKLEAYVNYTFFSWGKDAKNKCRVKYYPNYGKSNNHYMKYCKDVLFYNDVTKQHNKYLAKRLYNFGKFSIAVFVIVFLGLMFWFWLYGRGRSEMEISRGGQIVPFKRLNKLIRKKYKCDLNLGGVSIPKFAESEHFMMAGDTGQGKSTANHHLLEQLRKRGDKVIIIDDTGEYTSKYFREGQDILLNPLDKRTANWTPWADILQDTHYDTMAASIMPADQSAYNSHNKIWTEGGKAIISAALQKVVKMGYEHPSMNTYKIIVESSDEAFDEFFAGTKAATYTSKGGEKLTKSFKATIVEYVNFFKYLTDEDTFSIKKWLADDEIKDQWLFISVNEDNQDTLRSYVSAIVDTAIRGTLALDEDHKRRVWFLLDELGSLQKINVLDKGISRLRKYGGCIVAGFQNMAQLEQIYGREATQTIVSNFKTKLIFATDEPKSQKYLSEVIGSHVISKTTETLSYGANEIRDGVTENRSERIESIVMPSEIKNIARREPYLLLSDFAEITQVKFEIKDLPKIADKFVVNDGIANRSLIERKAEVFLDHWHELYLAKRAERKQKGERENTENQGKQTQENFKPKATVDQK